MKKQVIFTAISLMLAVTGLDSCKKSNDTKTPDPVLKNTTWTGEFNYNGGTTQPMSIAFLDGGNLTWAEFKGEYSGSWAVTNGILTISLGGSVSFTANISSDNTLTNIKSTDGSGRKLLNTIPGTNDYPVLEGTKWVSPSVSLTFKAGTVLDLAFGGASEVPTYTNIPYIRKGKAIYFTLTAKYDWFTILSTSTTMKGINMAPNDATVYTFAITKQ
jgi:hypothetical protein